jgi:hypothetical protein
MAVTDGDSGEKYDGVSVDMDTLLEVSQKLDEWQHYDFTHRFVGLSDKLTGIGKGGLPGGHKLSGLYNEGRQSDQQFVHNLEEAMTGLREGTKKAAAHYSQRDEDSRKALDVLGREIDKHMSSGELD